MICNCIGPLYSLFFTNTLHDCPIQENSALPEPIFKQLHLLKSYDIYKCQLLKFLFKLVNKQLPAYFNQLPFAFNNQLHHHETRGFKRAFVPRVNHEFSKRNIRYIAAVTYNSTSDSVIAKIYTHSLLGFSTYVKNQIIKHYNNRCTIEHCYSCRQYLNILNINFDLNI